MSDTTKKLTHFDAAGRVRQVDVGPKNATDRSAEASGLVRLSPQTRALVRDGKTAKGDPLEVARIAAVMAPRKQGRSWASPFVTSTNVPR